MDNNPFMTIAQLTIALKADPLNQYPGAWEYQIDDTWRVAVNAHQEQVDIPARDGHMGAEIPPFHAAVWYNGWLAGIFHPYDGWFAAGEGANPQTFTRAVERKLFRMQYLERDEEAGGVDGLRTVACR